MEPEDAARFTPNDEVDEMRWVDLGGGGRAAELPHDAELVAPRGSAL